MLGGDILAPPWVFGDMAWLPPPPPPATASGSELEISKIITKMTGNLLTTTMQKRSERMKNEGMKRGNCAKPVPFSENEQN